MIKKADGGAAYVVAIKWLMNGSNGSAAQNRGDGLNGSATANGARGDGHTKEGRKAGHKDIGREMNHIRRYSLRRQCLDQAFYGTFMGHMRQTREQPLCAANPPVLQARHNEGDKKGTKGT
ncbi:MAG: hypothetical protein HY017_02110 [Betaproteobacteria bacterium]|nr:hypothetical protein [Betaproteobacteria bacterium]